MVKKGVVLMKASGKDIELEDVDGKEFVREMIEAAKSRSTFRTDYKYTNPLTKKVEQKSMYCERVDESTLLCDGIHRADTGQGEEAFCAAPPEAKPFERTS